MDTCFREAQARGYWLIAWNVTWNDIWTRTHTMQGDLETRLERLAALPSVPLNTAGLELARSYVKKVGGDLRGAREDAQEGLSLYERIRLEKMAWRCKLQLAEVLVELGRLEEAEGVLPPVSSRTELQDIVYDAPAQIRYRLARREIDAAVSLAREILTLADKLALYRETLAVAAEAFAAGGRLDEAQAVIDRGRAHPTTAGSTYLDEAQGRVLLARDDPAAALPFLRDAVQAAERVGFRLVELRGRVLLAEAKARLGDLDEAARELRSVVAAADQSAARLIRDAATATADALAIPRPVPAEEPAEPRSEPEVVALGERLVTSMFADVRGYTALTTTTPPEELAERMAALYRFAKTEIERHHGIVDKFAGDAVMATFNLSGTRVDHCAHALEAALTLRDKAALMDLRLGIGIAVGPAVVSRGASDANIAVRGVATNLAARLQAAAGGGEILLSEEAHRRVERWLTERGVRAQPEELALKGFGVPQVGYRIPAAAAEQADLSQR